MSEKRDNLEAKQIAETTIRIKQDRLRVVEAEREALKDEIRALEKHVEDLCPLICSCCQRGAWEPHRHSFEVGRKTKYYFAERIPRQPTTPSLTSPAET